MPSSAGQETTIAGLNGALEVVETGGIVAGALYPGHQGGQAEADAVLEWSGTVPSERAAATCYRFLNTKTRTTISGGHRSGRPYLTRKRSALLD